MLQFWPFLTGSARKYGPLCNLNHIFLFNVAQNLGELFLMLQFFQNVVFQKNGPSERRPDEKNTEVQFCHYKED